MVGPKQLSPIAFSKDFSKGAVMGLDLMKSAEDEEDGGEARDGTVMVRMRAVASLWSKRRG